MKLALLLVLLTVNVFTFNLFVNEPTDVNDDKVKIDFYYESLCPYCAQFMEGSLKTAAATKDLWKICDFRLFPYGNARTTKVGNDDYSFTCQHGTRECEGNFIETCALKIYSEEYANKALPFIICLEASTSNWDLQGKKCATQYGLDYSKISACATSKEGRQYENAIGEATAELVPAHQYVPWVVVNNAHSNTTESAVRSNMVKFVCDNYKGSIKIDAC